MCDVVKWSCMPGCYATTSRGCTTDWYTVRTDNEIVPCLSPTVVCIYVVWTALKWFSSIVDWFAYSTVQCTGPVFPGCLPVAQCGSRRCGDSVHVWGWSLLRSKKGLQTLTMCGVLASSLIVNTHTYQQCEIVKMGPTSPEAHMAMCAATYIRFKGGDDTAVNTEWNVV